MSYERIICYLVSLTSFVFAGFFDNSTIYGSASVATPYVKDNIEVDDDYEYNHN